jgi:titin
VTPSSTTSTSNAPSSPIIAEPVVVPVPAQITQVQAEAGFDAASLTWTVPANEGTAISHFTITPSLSGTAETPIVLKAGAPGSLLDPKPGSVDTEEVTGLLGGSSYTFTITATNAKGKSVPSVATAPVVPSAAASASYVPKRVTAAPGYKLAKIHWVVPGDNGSPVTSFEITPYVGATAQTPITVSAGAAGSALDPTPGAVDHASVAGLVHGTSYTFTVKATNAIADSAESAPSTAVNPTDVPATAAAPDAVTTTTRQVKVSWIVPVGNGLPVTSFTLLPYVGTTAKAPEVVAAGAVGSHLSPAPGAHDSTTLSLALGKTYTVTVTAANANGSSTASAPSNAVVNEFAPLAPSQPSVKGSPEEALVKWTVPSDGGSAITTWNVWVYGPGAASRKIVLSPGSGGLSASPGAQDSYLVLGLEDAQSYQFAVSAQNTVGTSPKSPRSRVLANLGVPGVSTNVVATLYPSDDAMTITWTVPSSGGGTFTAFNIGVYVDGTYEGELGTVSVPSGQSPAPGATVGIELQMPPSGYTWQFNVVAVGTGGIGAPSAPSNPVST